MSEEKEAGSPFWLSGGAVDSARDGLRQAAKEGVLPVDDYVQSVTTCSICGDPVACHAALTGDADAACRNAQLIRELTAPATDGGGTPA